MTLVLALDIDGIDEYFEKQAQKHTQSSLGGRNTLFLYNLRKSETEENCYYGYDYAKNMFKIYYDGDVSVVEGKSYSVSIVHFRNLDYPDGVQSENDPVCEVKSRYIALYEPD
jgi:hypothetical protein